MPPFLKQHFGLMGSLLQASLWLCFAVLQAPYQVIASVHAGQNSGFWWKPETSLFPINLGFSCLLLKINRAGGEPAGREQEYKTVLEESCWESQPALTSSFSLWFSMILREIGLSRDLARLLGRDSKDQIDVMHRACWRPQRCCKINSRACYCYYSNITRFL